MRLFKNVYLPILIFQKYIFKYYSIWDCNMWVEFSLTELVPALQSTINNLHELLPRKRSKRSVARCRREVVTFLECLKASLLPLSVTWSPKSARIWMEYSLSMVHPKSEVLLEGILKKVLYRFLQTVKMSRD